ncbi:MAG: type transport system permease protein, partial [Frankiaceae bacterium]|nr:type transport system permease protein [Frankiaceae bacterium]
MVGLFVRLKLRLLANGLRMGAAYVTGFVLISVLGVLASLLAAAALAASDNNTAVFLYTAIFGAWVVLPVVMSAADETLEPSRLLVFPITGREKARGFFVAAFVGIGPAVSTIALAGSVVGAGAVQLVAVALVAAVLELMLCVSASRALTTTLSGVLRSRRGRDLAAGAVVLVGLLPVLGNVLIGRLLKGATPNEGTARLAAGMRWTPPGMAAHAIGDAAAGRWLAVAGELALVAVCVGLLVACWLRGLGRITVTHDASSSTVRDGRGLLL